MGRILALALLAITIAAQAAQARVGGGFTPHHRRIPECTEGLVSSGCYCHGPVRGRELCRPGQYCHLLTGMCSQ